MLTTKLQNIGGSIMFAIPKALLEGLNLRPNASVGVSMVAGRLIVDPHPRQRYTLAELLAQCDTAAPYSNEDRAWLGDSSMGAEEI